jgi:ATP-dependent Lon protease
LGDVNISNEVLVYIIEVYAKEEHGVRELRRCLDQIVQKINMLRLYNSPDLPYHISNFSLPFTITTEHVRLLLKKREDMDAPPPFMYL